MPVFSGGADTLEFVAPLSEQVGIPGLYILRLGLEARGDHQALVLTRWLLHPDVLQGTAEVPEWEPLSGDNGVPVGANEDQDIAAGAFGVTILIEAVDEFEITYFGPEDDAQGARNLANRDQLPEADWLAEWFDRQMPPYALRLHLTTPGSTWPDLIARPFPMDAQSTGIITF